MRISALTPNGEPLMSTTQVMADARFTEREPPWA